MKNYKEFTAINEYKLTVPSLKVSAAEAKEKITDSVGDFLKISKDKINDPENQEKVKNFLSKLEQEAIKIKSFMKTKKGQNRAILLSSISMYSSLIAGIWGMVFNSGLEKWWNPGSFELGGVFFIKLALFLFVIRLILKAYKNINEFTGFVSGIKNFITSIINLFRKNNKEEVVQENINLLLEKYEIY